MPRHSIALAHLVSPGGIEFSEVENSLWMVVPTGQILALRLSDRRLTVHDGYDQPVAVLPGPDGLTVVVVESTGSILTAPRDDAGRGNAVTLVELEADIVAARLHPDGAAALVLEAGDSARLLRVDLADGTIQLVADGLALPSALTVEVSTRRAVVLERPAAGPRLIAVDIDSGALEVLGPADDVTAVVSAPDAVGPGVIAVSGATGETLLRSLGAAPDVAGPTVGAPVRALARWESLLLAVTASSVEAIEWGLDDGVLPIAVPLGPAFVHGWLRVQIDPAAFGIAPSDVTLSVDEGPLAGVVSAGTEPPGPGGVKRFRVLTGPVPGEYHLSARRTSDGTLLGQARFRVTRHWPDLALGPPVVIDTAKQYFLMWGGGPNAAQNIGNNKAPENWRVAFVFVSTADRRSPDDLSAAQVTWTERLTGNGRSVRTFYEEVSYRKTPAAPGGPLGTTMSLVTPMARLDLGKGWGDYFEQPKDTSTWLGWDPKQTTWTAIAGAFSDVLDRAGQGTFLQQFDAVVFVVQTASDGATMVGSKLALAKYVWPQAHRGEFHWRIPGGPWVYVEKPIVFMPSEPPSAMPATATMKRVDPVFVLCHELGHTLGCGDLYDTGDLSAEVAARTIDALDLMDDAEHLPHFSLPNRMRLGWIGAAWIERFDFSVSTAPRDVVLHAAEALGRAGPPAGRAAGIEIRVQDGWNYYFEYRRAQPGQHGDQELSDVSPGPGFVVGTDVIVLGKKGKIAGGDDEVRRPQILLLPADVDGDGPVLDVVAEDYEETDVTNPDAAYDFRLRFDGLVAADANAARVHVEYVAARRADLRIRPAPGQGNWKSPDIDLEGPKGPNAVAKGLQHTIVVHVRNAGTEDARSVGLKVSWLPCTTSPGTWTVLTPPPRLDIGKGKTVEFRVPWTPPKAVYVAGESADHFCVKVDVERYVDPSDPAHNEIIVANNWAQSNFDSADLPHGSPPERRTTGFTIANRLPHAATYLTVADLDRALCRIYLGNAWVRLGAGEVAEVELGYESLADDPIEGARFAAEFETLARRPPPLLSLTALVVSREQGEGDAPRVVWGTNLSLRIGRRTRVRVDGLFERIVRGTVVSLEDGVLKPATRGRVNVVLWLAEQPDRQLLCGDAVNATGRFDAVVPREIYDAAQAGRPILGEALYLGAWPWAASRSGTRRLR